MKLKKFVSVPRVFNWIIILIVVNVNLNYRYWEDKNRIIVWDAISYYAYLPATFIYNDLSLQYADTAPEEVKEKIWYGTSPTGQRVIKTSCGLSMLYCPFFLAAHVYAKNSQYSANGYTLPYRVGIIISCMFFLSIGLYFLRKILIQFFPPMVTVLTCFVIAFGTNLFYYSTTELSYSHAYSFALIAAFIYFSILFLKTPTLKYTLILGLLLGSISLTRPTNIIIVLFLIFWDVKSIEEFKIRVRFFLSNYLLVITMMACTFIVWIPQLLYWKTLSGHWLYNSYGETERFFFNDPKIVEVLFSYRKGWLVYTPVMAFALLGVFLLRKNLKAFFIPILLFICLNLYIISSWWCWWYGGSFGLRSMVDCYAVMAIPLAAILLYALQKSKTIFYSLTAVLIILVVFQQFQNQQYRTGAIHWDGMNKKVYWANFGKLQLTPHMDELIDLIDYERARQGHRDVSPENMMPATK